jgi:hypothetical protein
MKMDHPKETQDLIAEAEKASGYPVTVVSDSELTTHSALSFPRGSLPANVIRYNPKYERRMDYIVTYHCGFVLRFFSDPRGERMDFGTTGSGRFNVEKLVKRLDIAKHLPSHHLETFCERILTGLMTHLRSTPIGLRVEAWIESELPSIADQQKSGIEQQLKENLLPIKGEVKKMTPEKIYDATLSVSAAYAIYWAEKWDQSQLVLPYRTAGYEEKGKRLMEIFNELPDAPSNDRELIDAWADELGVGSWHTWVPYQEP